MPKSSLPHEDLRPALEAFAKTLTAKFSASGAGEPEDQLKPTIETLLQEYARITGIQLVLKGESTLEGRLGRPDFAVHAARLPIGYIELKAPGKGANPDLYKGHDKEQWKRFQNVPNILYTDGNEWTLYRTGVMEGKRVRLEGDVRTDGAGAVTPGNAEELFALLAAFTSWTPLVPTKPKPLAEFLAPHCRLLRDEVMDCLQDDGSALHDVKRELKQLLFPEADDLHFADAYAQTVVFALLLAQMEGADVLDLSLAEKTLEHQHLLLSRSLQFLTLDAAGTEIASPLSLIQRVVHEIPPALLKGTSSTTDPWLFFYEDFLAAYDPQFRKAAGVYYTPVEVVNCQVRLIDEILTTRFGKTMGFVEPGVVTLDPAVGTGTYLLAIIEHALKRVETEEGAGAIKGGARSLVQNLHGFEWMVGPYAVAQLRVARAITSHGSTLPNAGLGVYLTNTLESPHTNPPMPGLFHKPIARERERALKVKDSEHVLVCLGNPPYGRHAATTDDNHAVTGGWVRYGDFGEPTKPILEDFLQPARKGGHGVHLKNLYNLYVYFIRWSLWKVFEHRTAAGPGILSFITASSYLDGDAFVGVREHMRRVADHILVIDLGGEGRGTRQDENVFAIQTPVAIFVAWRDGAPNPKTPAEVRYTRIGGDRGAKLASLEAVRKAEDLDWEPVPSDWQAPFRPEASGIFTEWPQITSLMPWTNNGVKAGRTWVIAPSHELLVERLNILCSAGGYQRAELFKNSPTGRKIADTPRQIPPTPVRLRSLQSLEDASEIEITPFAYRSFDRQKVIADARFLDRAAPSLWHAHSEKQIYLASLFSIPFGVGSALTASAFIPDLDNFRGSYGAKAVIPLYRNASSTEANITPDLLPLLEATYGKPVTPEDFAGYLYAVLAHPEYTTRFQDELTNRQVRVPLTKNAKLFRKASTLGKNLLWLHTYGERLHDAKHPKGQVPRGKAKCETAVPDSEDAYPNEFHYNDATKTLHVGAGTFRPVSPDVFAFEVSGLKVVQSWLGYRMRERSGRKSSPLDDIRPKTWTYEFTRELLELLWVLEATVEGYPAQARLFEAILESDLFTEGEMPGVPDAARKPPSVPKPTATGDIFEETEESTEDDDS